MRTVTVTLDVPVPFDATDEELEEWLKYETGYNGCISNDNPLSEKKLFIPK